MSRVLIWNRIRPGSELDIFHPTDYSGLYDHVMTKWNGVCQNWGNRLWFQGICSALDTGENTYDFLPDIIDFDKINSEYDFIILSMANVFHSEYAKGMRAYAELFQHIQIPVYVIACGVQADSYDTLQDVVSALRDDASRFISSVYRTGGEFALRGHFTKEFFDQLGFHSAVVTGCPSLYQFGPEFRVAQEHVDPAGLRPVFNGRIRNFSGLMAGFPTGVFMDQDEFIAPLFQPDYLAKPDLRFQMDFLGRYGTEAARFLAEDRIRMIADMNDWWNYLQNEGFNYAFGARIHGTIMSLLSGIPATIVVCDSRTREMAEFFDIPMYAASGNHRLSVEELQEQYQRMDYTAFNAGFAERFHNYEKFLTDHNIVSHANTDNRFFRRDTSFRAEAIGNLDQTEFSTFADTLHRNEKLLKMALLLRRIRGRIPL